MTQLAPKSLFVSDARAKRRNAADRRFRAYGLGAIGLGLVMLSVLIVTIVSKGTGAFQQSFITLDVELLEAKLDKKGTRNLEEIKKVTTFGYAPLLKNAIESAVSDQNITTD